MTQMTRSSKTIARNAHILGRIYSLVLEWGEPVQQTATSNDLGKEIEVAGEGKPSLVEDPAMSISSKSSTQADLLSLLIQKLDRGSSPDKKWPDLRGNYWPLCPYHADNKPGSFSVGEKGFHCFSCGEKGGLRKLAEKLGIITEHPETNGAQGLTLDAYASAKRLPLDFLRGLGVTDRAQNDQRVLKIPYRNQSGEEIATRYRIGPDGNKRFWWTKGSRIIPYGIWRCSEPLHCCTQIGGGGP